MKCNRISSSMNTWEKGWGSAYVYGQLLFVTLSDHGRMSQLLVNLLQILMCLDGFLHQPARHFNVILCPILSRIPLTSALVLSEIPLLVSQFLHFFALEFSYHFQDMLQGGCVASLFRWSTLPLFHISLLLPLQKDVCLELMDNTNFTFPHIGRQFVLISKVFLGYHV